MIPPPPAPLLHALHDRPVAPLCVGFSGGLDSTTLLHLLAVHGREAVSYTHLTLPTNREV